MWLDCPEHYSTGMNKVRFEHVCVWWVVRDRLRSRLCLEGTFIIAALPSRPTSAEVAASRRCAACDHRWDAHDEVAARFCAATAVSRLTRGCVCAPGAAVEAG